MRKALEVVIHNPQDAIELTRSGISLKQAEAFLEENDFQVIATLKSLSISKSSFFNKSKPSPKLNSEISEKFLRLVRINSLAKRVLGEDHDAASVWLRTFVPSLGNQKPIDLLDTDTGYRLVEDALLQIQYGIYS